MIGRCARCARPSHWNICWRCRRLMFVAKSVGSGGEDGSSVAVPSPPDPMLEEDLRRVQAAVRHEWRTRREFDDMAGEDEHDKDLA